MKRSWVGWDPYATDDELWEANRGVWALAGGATNERFATLSYEGVIQVVAEITDRKRHDLSTGTRWTLIGDVLRPGDPVRDQLVGAAAPRHRNPVGYFDTAELDTLTMARRAQRTQRDHATLLATWNPAKWNWDDYLEAVEATGSGRLCRSQWSTGSRNSGVEPGDRVFLLVQGAGPRGIIGSGTCRSRIFAAAHWDRDRSDQDARYLLVDWETLVPVDDALGRTELVAQIPAGGDWRPQASGTILRPDVAADLERLWAAHLGKPEPVQPRTSTHRELAGGISSDRVDPTNGIPMDRDQLDIGVWVSMLATVVVDARTPMPLSIGIFGEWGSGKSHFMGMLRRRIEELAGAQPGYLEHVIPISFNAWHYSDTNLWASLGDEIFRQLAGAGRTPAQLRAEIRANLTEHSVQQDALKVRTQLAREEIVRLRRQLDVALVERQSNARTLLHAAAKAETVRDLLKQAMAGLGVTDEAEQAEVLADQLRDAASTAAVGRGRFRRQATWVVAAVTTVAVAVLAASGWLPSALGRLGAGAVGLAGLATALAVGLRWTRGVSMALRKLNQAAAEVRRLALDDTERDLKAAFDQLHTVEAMEKVTESQLAEMDAQVAELTHQLTELMPGQRLYSFIAGRAGSEVYAGHLGLISTIRRDFDQLVRLIADWRQGGEPDGSPRPVDRIVLYIDDLDRCRPKQVVEVLQAVHLLLALDLFVVVVGVDPRWLLRSLSDQYGGLLGAQMGADPKGADAAAMPQEYLEKIFNIPFALPSMPRGGLGRMIRSLVQADRSRADATIDDSAPDEPATTPVAGHTDVDPDAVRSGPADGPLAAEAGSEVRATTVVEPPRQLTEPELALLAELETLIDNPRAGKRLLNLYRMLRSTRDLSSASRFLGDDGGPGEYQAVVVLLGMVVADASITRHILDAPPKAGSNVAGGLMARPPATTWPAFLEDLRPVEKAGWHNRIVGTLPAEEVAAWQRLAAGLARFDTLIALPDLIAFQRWAPHVRRFSFILSPLAPTDSVGLPG